MINTEMFVGAVFKTNSGVDCEVIKYENFYNVYVKFHDKFNTEVKTSVSAIRRGSVSSKNVPSLIGIGYLGVGNINKNNCHLYSRIHGVWSRMIRRCYCPKVLKADPSYIGCTVHEDWHSFQVFASWYISQEFCDCGYDIDKDLLVKGNKVYSADTCCLLPTVINKLLIRSYKSDRKCSNGVKKQRNSYIASMTVNGDKIYLGSFKTNKEAAEAYKTNKEKAVREFCLTFKDKVDERAYEALQQWTI